jgi:hypothetical protein
MRCLSCKYDLSHLAEHRCPECGRAFDPSDARTYDAPDGPSRKYSRLSIWIAGWCLALGSFLLAVGSIGRVAGPDRVEPLMVTVLALVVPCAILSACWVITRFGWHR